MPNSALTWKALNIVTLSSLTESGYIAAVKAALDSTTYKNGNARTPGSGVAWTATARQALSTASLEFGNHKTRLLSTRGFLLM